MQLIVRAALVAGLTATGCAAATVHPSAIGVAPNHVGRVETDWSRQSIPAEGVTVHATLWDASLVASAVAQAPKGIPVDAWTDRYLRQTAFTVVIELEDRRPWLDPAPLLDPAAWSFAMRLNKDGDASGSDLHPPSSVDLLLVDRFPTHAGTHHHRIVLAVFFEGSLHARARETDGVSLVVKPQLEEAEGNRSALGAMWSARGTTLRWRVTAG